MSSVPDVSGAQDPDKDVCYVEASAYDKARTSDSSKTSENVWQAVRPPARLRGGKPPLVSSRKLEIVRAQLNGRIKGKEEAVVSRESVRVSISRISRRTKF